jgi:hypothetical protein
LLVSYHPVKVHTTNWAVLLMESWFFLLSVLLLNWHFIISPNPFLWVVFPVFWEQPLMDSIVYLDEY